ncbi:hypothetical protein AB0M43_09985 [Longispora sp. NPDC051575]|uniref:hypothetical protein n=1 Tax=Longispora sp. NPDC051575 TaxID=3154943 RepID=UPI0034298EBF
MLLIHVKRSPVRWIFPVALAFNLAMLFFRNRYWIGVWPETSAAAQMPAYLTSGLAAAAAAWSVGAPHRHGTVEQKLPLAVPRWRREVPPVATVLLYFVLISLIVQAIAFGLTLRTNPPGIELWPGYVVMGLTVICLAVAFGHVVGKALSGRFAAAVAGLAWFIVSMYLGSQWDFGVVSGPVYNELDTLTVMVRLLGAVALISLAVALPNFLARERAAVSRRTERRWLRPAVVVTVAAVVLCAVTAVLGSPVKGREKPAEVLCVGVRLKVCMWPEHQKYQSAVEDIVQRAERLPAVFVLPGRFDEYGVSYQMRVVDGVIDLTDRSGLPPYFYIPDGSTWALSGTVATEIMKVSLRYCAKAPFSKGEQVDLRANETEAWLEAFLAGGGRPDYHTNRSGEAAAAARRGEERANHGSEAEQFAWAGERVTEYNAASCL